MATFYFGDFVNLEWTELGNWVMESPSGPPATSLPTSSDSVVLMAPAEYSGAPPTVVNLTTSNAFGYNEFYVGGYTVTGVAKFYNSAILAGMITGNAEFYDSATISGGEVTGTATFSLSAARAVIDSHPYVGECGSIAFDYETGINGSSILGVV
jgi:hypothetical protein